MRGVRLVTIVCAVSMVLAVAAEGACASAPDDPARIVYSNGGRIISMSADGSDRTVLTHKGKVRGRDLALGGKQKSVDRAPKVSPDGSEVLFVRHPVDPASYDDFFADDDPPAESTMVVPAEGGRAHRLLRDRKGKKFRDATWIPGSSDLLAVRWDGKKRARNSVVVVGRGGKVKRTILSFRAPKPNWFLMRRRMPRFLVASELAVSPDGKRFLMTLEDRWFFSEERRLEVVNLKSGKRRLVRKEGAQGRWSRDGKRIVFVAPGRGEVVCSDYELDCRSPFDLFTAGPKGGKVRRVKATNYDERWPAFSPDGSSLVFSANRNQPDSEAAHEIYRMATGGRCLTWLTNGSPASLDPAWGPGATQAAGCAVLDREPLIEGSPAKLAAKWGPRFWLGPSYRNELISSSVRFSGISLVDYRDCGFYHRRHCRQPVTVVQAPVCLLQRTFPLALGILASRHRSMRKLHLKDGRTRGVRYRLGYLEGYSFGLAFTGPSLVAVARKSGGPRSGRLDQLALLKRLQAIGGKTGGALPGFRVPRAAYRRAAAVKRTVRRLGLRKAKRRLGMNRWEIRAYTRFRANLHRVGPARPIGCKGVRGFDGFLDGSAAGRPVDLDVRALAERALEQPELRDLLDEASSLDLSSADIPEAVTRLLP